MSVTLTAPNPKSRLPTVLLPWAQNPCSSLHPHQGLSPKEGEDRQKLSVTLSLLRLEGQLPLILERWVY